MRLRSGRALRWPAIAVLAVGFLVAVVTLQIARPNQAGDPPAHGASAPSHPDGMRDDAQPPANGSARAEADPAAYQLERLRALMPVVASPATAVIVGEAAQQPDLYAAEFTRRLLTQDYRQPRHAHVQWVQAESATTTEPLVIGKVPPELRDRLAVYSVTDAADGPAPIPTPAEWAGLAAQQAYTTVSIDRVEEPFAWTNAVASGRISDPGITGRDVAATVTVHSTADGRPHIATYSVGLSLNLEGPPTRRTWGFVAAVSYTAIQVK